MKKILLLIYMMFPVLVMAQGHKGEVDECAPMKNGKVCYSDDVEIENTSKLEIFNAINAWAKKSYGKDVFLSNVNSNKNKGTIFVSSKVELLLNDTDKTIIKYKMRITCFDNRYTIEASDIVYQYDPLNDKKYKTYKAEDVIANNGVCYSDDVEIENTSKLEIFNAINAWAKKSYGKDVFLSNVNSNKNKGTIFVSSKVELLLNDTDKTIIKYKMRITCFDNRYTIEASDIVYQYDPLNDKKYKTYKAEDVIANNGDSNTIALIKDPKLFCNATFFFVENLFADVFDAAQNAESE